MSDDAEDDEELHHRSFGDDDDDEQRTPPPLDRALAAWKAADAARRRVARVAREQRDRGIHLFGRAQILGVENPRDPGRLGRMEIDMADLKATQARHGTTIDRLDRIAWKIIVAASLAGAATAIIIKVIIWAFEKG